MKEIKISKENIQNPDRKTEVEENKMVLFLQKFWEFSLFYGEYLGSLHSKKKRSFKDL